MLLQGVGVREFVFHRVRRDCIPDLLRLLRHEESPLLGLDRWLPSRSPLFMKQPDLGLSCSELSLRLRLQCFGWTV